MVNDLKGKVVILTGASMGLGRQMAVYFYKLGMKVSICARRTEKLMETVKLCEESGGDGEVFAMTCDVGQYDQLKNYVEKTVERFGTIDHLINNANLEAVLVPFESQTEKELHDALRIGCLGHFRLMKLCTPYMKGKGGSMVNFVSGVYQMGMDLMTSYVADKGAIRGLAMVAARELGKYGIRVNTVAPSAMTDTIYEKLPPEFREWAIKCSSCNAMERLGEPATDIPPVVAWLMSEDSKWVTGQNINIDGGACIYGL